MKKVIVLILTALTFVHVGLADGEDIIITSDGSLSGGPNGSWQCTGGGSCTITIPG